jgi:hypothetical protein
MSASDILNILTGHDGLFYRPYSPSDIIITAGAPPVCVGGWDYVWARYNNPQNKRFPNLGGRGVFVSNTDKSGLLEIGILQGMISGGALDILDTAGVAVPIVVLDKGSGGTSGVVATACRRVSTPEWRRQKLPEIVPFTFEVTHMEISWGLQLPEEE